MANMNDRRMIYPYTLTAKLVQFPFKFYYNNSPFFKYWIWSLFICAPIFYKIERLVKSPANYEKFEAYLKKNEEEYQKHLEHLIS